MSDSIQIRSKIEDGVTTVRAIIKHVMESGLRKDKETGKLIPGHYITEVTCTHNDQVVLSAKWGPAVSRDPYLSFRFKGAKAGDTLKLSWIDNQGGSDSTQVSL